MAENMKERFLSLGGRLLLGTRVEKINIKGGRAVSVRLEGGEEIEVDYVISAAEPKGVFENLIGRRMPRALEGRYNNKRLFLFSSYHAAYAVKGDKIPFRGDLIIEVSRKNRGILKSKYIVLREFSHERGFAPEGDGVIQATVFTSLSHSRRFIEDYEGDREKYREYKKRLAEALGEEIKMALPTLEGRIRLIDFWTPATYKRYTGAEYGSYMCFAFSSRFIPTPLPVRVRGVSNLFLATQWTSVPGGLPTAAKSGKLSAERIVEMEKRKTRGKAKLISTPAGAE
jgi:phytoene dehydrogenase-like protein